MSASPVLVVADDGGATVGVPKMTARRPISRGRTAAWVVAVVGLGAIVSPCQSLAQDKEQIVPQVVQQLEARQKAYRTIRYTATGRLLFPKGSLNLPGLPAHNHAEPVPSADQTAPASLQWSIDFPNNRLRKVSRAATLDPGSGRLTPTETVHVFDGANTKRFFPTEGNAGSAEDLLGWVKHGNTISYEFSDFPIFLAHGVVGLTDTLGAEFGPNTVLSPVPPGKMKVEGTRVQAGRPCVVVSLPIGSAIGESEDLWCDTALRGAVLRLEVRQGADVIRRRLDITYTDRGLLKGWTVTYFNDQRVTLSETYTVDKVDENPAFDEREFDIPLRPGWRVEVADKNSGRDTRYDVREYRVSDRGELVPLDQPPRQWGLGRTMGLGALVLAGVVGLAYLLRRRTTKRSGVAHT